jgi:hypothetical protein
MRLPEVPAVSQAVVKYAINCLAGMYEPALIAMALRRLAGLAAGRV